MIPRLGTWRRPIESYSKLWLGLIGAIVIGALVGGVALVSTLDLGKAVYTAKFTQAAQLVKGNQVTVAGIKVGSVHGIGLAGDHVVVTFTVDRNVEVGPESRAAIKLSTILGSRYLELSPAGNGELPDNTIDLSHTQAPYDLQDTLAGATNTLGPVEADRIAESIRVMNSSMQGLPEALPEALENINSLAAVMASRRDQLHTLLTNADTVTALLRQQKADLGALVLQGNELLDEITSRRAAMERLFEAATMLVDRAHIVLEDEPQIDALLTDLHEFAQLMTDHDALLRDLLQTAPITLRNLTNATGSGNAIDLNVPGGLLIDSWMCAVSGRAKQFNLVEYFKDCK